MRVTSHTRTVMSQEPEATRDPSGENTTLSTQLEWPSSVCIHAFHSDRSCVISLISSDIYAKQLPEDAVRWTEGETRTIYLKRCFTEHVTKRVYES
jgi:hypothetical protein